MEKDIEEKRTECEVYSRVVGYLRPVKQWNLGKQQEFEDRKVYDMKEKQDRNENRWFSKNFTA